MKIGPIIIYSFLFVVCLVLGTLGLLNNQRLGGNDSIEKETIQKTDRKQKDKNKDRIYTEAVCFDFDNGVIKKYKHENELCDSDVVIPSAINGVAVKSIGEEAFANANISTVYIPKGIVEIASGAFFKSGTSNPNLTTILNGTTLSLDWNSTVNKVNGESIEFGMVSNSKGNVQIVKE